MLSFSSALDRLKNGKRVARSGWNGRGMWIYLVEDWSIADDPDVPELRDLERRERLSAFIALRTADEKFVPWLASQTDILASDWEVVR